MDLCDMFKLWSNNRYKSTTHRVVRSQEGSRYSMPFFVHPEPNFVLAKGIKAKDYLDDRLRYWCSMILFTFTTVSRTRDISSFVINVTLPELTQDVFLETD